MQLLLWVSIYLQALQPFSKDNLATGHEQFNGGSVTGSEVKACTRRVDTDQLMSVNSPLSKKTAHLSCCTDCKTAFCADTDAAPGSEVQPDDTGRQLCYTTQGTQRLRTAM